MLNTQGILTEGRTIWRRVNAQRTAVLNDGATYFGALRSTLLKAQRSIFIVGWDIHSRTKLLGPSGVADDGWPECLGDLLAALAAKRRELKIYVLVWNSSLLYASEREWFSSRIFGRHEKDGISFCADDCLPIGSAQHQKIVVVDDAVAFSGGLDLTIRRWDTSEHLAVNRFRVDPDGMPYPPFHDVQMVVDGEAARAIAELTRHRWVCAKCGEASPISPVGDPWPQEVIPDFRDVAVGIARTEPAYDGRREINEVERSFFASIESAEKSIYIENQFLSSLAIGQRLIERMRRRPQLEILFIAPRTHSSWLEARTMRNGRLDFIRLFEEAGVIDRVKLLYPHVEDGEPVMVHSKVMVIDDRVLRVGSANLNNRSMGADTECDLAIEAQNQEERKGIARVRNALLAHHCGVDLAEIEGKLGENPSLLDAATLSGRGHSLQPVDDGDPDPREIVDVLEPIADPRQPLGLERAATATFDPLTLAKLFGIIISIAVFGIAWRFTPFSQYLDFDILSGSLQSLQGSLIAPVIVIAVFMLGGLIVFPVILLIAATAAALGPWIGFGSAALGVLASATLVFGIGRLVGKRPLKNILGPRLERVQEKIIGNGVVAIALIRMVPVAPFSLVNIAAGASGIRFIDYLIGTIIGMAPGLIAMSAFGSQIADVFNEPTWWSVGVLTASVTLWLLFSFAAQFVVTWLVRRQT